MQIANHPVDPVDLFIDLRQDPASVRLHFIHQQTLHLAGDCGERIVDLMTGAGGELGDGLSQALVEM